MKRKFWTLILLVGLLSVLLVLPVSAAEENYTVTVEGVQDYDEVNVVLNHVNQYRADAGAKPLVLDAELTKMAMQRAAELAVYYDHTRPDNTGCFTIIENSVFAYGSAGENIAKGYTSGADVSDGWYNSSGHYANMVKTSFTSIGIGHFYQPGGRHCWVQLFSSQSSGSVSSATGTKSFTTNVVVDPTLAELNIEEELKLFPGVKKTVQPKAGGAVLAKDSYSLTSANTAVVKTSGNTLTGVSIGDTKVTLSVSGRKASAPVSVVKECILKYTVEDNMAFVTWDNPDKDLSLFYRYEDQLGWYYTSTSSNSRYIAFDDRGFLYAKLCRYTQDGIYEDASREFKVTLAGMKEAKITTQPKTTYTKQGATAKATVKATGDNLSYQWYVKNAGATKYSKSSNTTATYSVKMSSTSKDRSIYCVITDEYGNKVQSKTVILRMAATIITQPKSVTVASGESAAATVKAAGDGLTYQWYYKNAGASKFSLTDSFKGNTYAVTMKDERDGRQVYCIITDKYGKRTRTDTVTLSMEHHAKITTQPKSVAVADGEKAKVTVKATGDDLTYKWYYKSAGASKFSLTTSYKGSSYSVAMNADRDGRQVYCVVTDKYGNSVKSNTVTLKMENPAKITTQPTSVTVASGESAKVTVKATGDGLTYKWYFKNAGSSKFSLTTSFTGNSYAVTMKGERDGRQVYCVVIDKYGNKVQSNTVTLSMEHHAKITTQPKSVTVANGEKAKVTVKATGDGLTYKWYYKSAGATKFSLTTAYKGSSYSVIMDKTRSGRQVYCVVTDQYGNSVKSEVATLKMK